MKKYFKPASLTWWSALVPLSAGIFVATVPMHGFAGAAAAIVNATEMTAPVLINIGLAGIGLRGAIA